MTYRPQKDKMIRSPEQAKALPIVRPKRRKPGETPCDDSAPADVNKKVSRKP